MVVQDWVRQFLCGRDGGSRSGNDGGLGEMWSFLGGSELIFFFVKVQIPSAGQCSSVGLIPSQGETQFAS